MKINQSDYVTPIPEDTPEEKHKGRKNKKKRAKAVKLQSEEKKTLNTSGAEAEDSVDDLPVEDMVGEVSVEESNLEASSEEVVEKSIEDSDDSTEEETIDDSVTEESMKEPDHSAKGEPTKADVPQREPAPRKQVKKKKVTSFRWKKKNILIGAGSVVAAIMLVLILKSAIVPVSNDLPFEEKTTSDTKDYVRNYNPKAEDVVVDKADRSSKSEDGTIKPYTGPVRDVNNDGVVDDEDYRYYRPGTDTNAYRNKDENASDSDGNNNLSDNKKENGKTNDATDKPVKVETKENILNFFAPDNYDGTGTVSKGNSGKTPGNNTTLGGTKASGFDGKIYAIGFDNEGKELTFEYDVKDLLDTPLNLNTYTTVAKPKSLSGDKEKAYWKNKSEDTLMCQLSGSASDSEFYYSNDKDGADYIKKHLGEPSCIYVSTDTDEAFLVYNFGTYYAIAGFVHQSSKPQLSYVSFYTASYWEINRNLFLGNIVYGQEF